MTENTIARSAVVFDDAAGQTYILDERSPVDTAPVTDDTRAALRIVAKIVRSYGLQLVQGQPEPVAPPDREPRFTTSGAVDHIAGLVEQFVADTYYSTSAKASDARARLAIFRHVMLDLVEDLDTVCPASDFDWYTGSGISLRDLDEIGDGSAPARAVKEVMTHALNVIKARNGEERGLSVEAFRIVGGYWAMYGDDLCEAATGQVSDQ